METVILGLLAICFAVAGAWLFTFDKKLNSILIELRQISHNTTPPLSKPLPPQPGGRVLRKPKTINVFDDADVDNRADEWIP